MTDENALSLWPTGWTASEYQATALGEQVQTGFACQPTCKAQSGLHTNLQRPTNS